MLTETNMLTEIDRLNRFISVNMFYLILTDKTIIDLNPINIY